MSVSVQGFTLRVIEGQQKVNGAERTGFVDECDRTVTVIDTGNREHLAAAAFDAGVVVGLRGVAWPAGVGDNVTIIGGTGMPECPLLPEGSPEGEP